MNSKVRYKRIDSSCNYFSHLATELLVELLLSYQLTVTNQTTVPGRRRRQISKNVSSTSVVSLVGRSIESVVITTGFYWGPRHTRTEFIHSRITIYCSAGEHHSNSQHDVECPYTIAVSIRLFSSLSRWECRRLDDERFGYDSVKKSRLHRPVRILSGLEYWAEHERWIHSAWVPLVSSLFWPASLCIASLQTFAYDLGVLDNPNIAAGPVTDQQSLRNIQASVSWTCDRCSLKSEHGTVIEL